MTTQVNCVSVEAANVACGGDRKIYRVTDYLEIQERRKELERQARELKKIEQLIEQEMREMLELFGPYEEDGYQIRWSEKPGRVAWKQEFVKRLGPVEAAKVQAECPPVKVIEIVKIR